MPYPEYIPYQPKKNWLRVFLAVVAILTIAGLLLYQIPYIHRRASWRLDIAYTYARMLLNPAHDLPTPSLPTPAVQVQSEAQMQTAASAPPTLTPEPSPTPQPEPSTTRTVTSPLPAKTAALLVLGLICGVALIVFATVVIAAVVVRM